MQGRGKAVALRTGLEFTAQEGPGPAGPVTKGPEAVGARPGTGVAKGESSQGKGNQASIQEGIRGLFPQGAPSPSHTVKDI